MSNESVTSLKKRVYIKMIMIIKLKTRWEAFLICKNNQPKVLFFFAFFLREHYGKTGGFNLVDEKNLCSNYITGKTKCEWIYCGVM